MSFEKGGFAMGNKGDANGTKWGMAAADVIGDGNAEPDAGVEATREAAAEHLSRDFARVRARLAVDPALVGRSLEAAWTTDVMEEDEAEFVDTLADCMGAGLSLETALTGWDIGTLVTDPIQETVAAEEYAEEDASDAYVTVAMAHRQTPGSRRVLVR
ncbi:MAG TPA: hypothetical protein VHU40_04265 [Polyangia bacterium]|jgi:hypothetical protein|nr:hypothetical protein [Polyangia bacterium]